jgi:hypothetical protein
MNRFKIHKFIFLLALASSVVFYIGCGGGDGEAGPSGDNGDVVEDLPTKITRVTQTVAMINVNAALYIISADENALPSISSSAKQVFPGELVANPLVDAEFPPQSCESGGTLEFSGRFTRSNIAGQIRPATDYFYIMELILSSNGCNGLSGTYHVAVLFYASDDGSGPGVLKIQILDTDGLNLDGVEIASMIVEADVDPDAEPNITYTASTVSADGTTMDCIVEDGSVTLNDHQGIDFTNVPFCSDNSDCYYPFIPLQCIDGKCNLPCWDDEFCLFDFFCNPRDPRASNWLDILAFLGGGICEETYHHIEPSAEICDNYIDDDANGSSDCRDFSCHNTPACTESLCDKDGDGETDTDCCVDGINNDRDHATDCEDSDCYDDPHCNEAGCLESDDMLDIQICCTDGLDNDGNGYTDCEDVKCAIRYPRCPPFEFCSNGDDDDFDGDRDCFDFDCLNDPVCVCGWLPCCAENGNDYMCSEDPSKTSHLGCEGYIGTGSVCEPIEGPHYGCCTLAVSETHPTETSYPCHDERDNDGDGYTDCFDSDCFGNPTCDDNEIQCTDGIDNDSDGKTDCDDEYCGEHWPSCSETNCGSGEHVCCWNDEDDDEDGLTDCDDPDCQNARNCNEGYCDFFSSFYICCQNGFDDDGDGLTDCDDPNCSLFCEL